MWITPKLNWTPSDYYNFNDLNRVENNTEFIRDYFNDIGFKIPLMTFNKTRDVNWIELISSINRVEQNIEGIKNNSFIPPEYISGKVWSNANVFNYEDANRYERNLEYFKIWGQRVIDSFIYCGEFYCGEEVI